MTKKIAYLMDDISLVFCLGKCYANDFLNPAQAICTQDQNIPSLHGSSTFLQTFFHTLDIMQDKPFHITNIIFHVILIASASRFKALITIIKH